MQAISLHSRRRNCNYTFANLIGWQFWFNSELWLAGDAVVLRFSPVTLRRAYMVCTAGVPSGRFIDMLLSDSGGRLTILGLEDDQAVALRDSRTDLNVAIEPRRDSYDYIYLREALAKLEGGRLKAKRNHVNRFVSEHPDYEYRELTPALFDECRRIETLWRDERGNVNPAFGDTIAAEHRVMENVFAHWDELGMIGGSIFIDGRMAAFTYGAAVTSDTFDVCVEKADRTVDGIFSVINQQFCSRLPKDFIYVNREEDMGLEGLRKAKLSYHPETLLTYNVVHITPHD